MEGLASWLSSIPITVLRVSEAGEISNFRRTAECLRGICMVSSTSTRLPRILRLDVGVDLSSGEGGVGIWDEAPDDPS